MLITSSHQIDEQIKPGVDRITQSEFEELSLKFGAFLCITLNKKMNFLQFLKYLTENKRTQDAFTKFTGEDSNQSAIRNFVYHTPNICKKVFQSNYNK